MKRVIIMLLVTALVFIMFPATNVTAIGQEGQAGKSNVARLYLFEQDPATSEVIEDGAWAKMKYRLSGPRFKFVFNGHGLVPRTDYTLIYYPDPWPGRGLICIRNKMSNEGGNLHLNGSVELNADLPAILDQNFREGAKILLVLSSDVDCTSQQMIGWNPSEYLFGNSLIIYDDTDL